MMHGIVNDTELIEMSRRALAGDARAAVDVAGHYFATNRPHLGIASLELAAGNRKRQYSGVRIDALISLGSIYRNREDGDIRRALVYFEKAGKLGDRYSSDVAEDLKLQLERNLK